MPPQAVVNVSIKNLRSGKTRNGHPLCLLWDISLDKGHLCTKTTLQSLSARDLLNARQLTPARASAAPHPCYLGSLEMKPVYSFKHSRGELLIRKHLARLNDKNSILVNICLQIVYLVVLYLVL